MPNVIPEVVVDCLPVYARALAMVVSEGRDAITSQGLATEVGLSPALVRKDLSYFGRFGKQGRGYDVRRLLNQLQRILGVDGEWTVTLVGAGRLGGPMPTLRNSTRPHPRREPACS